MPVFPGAKGFGTNTPAGRGGRIIRVTNLNDSGPGSLREALEAPGARIVVFEISGLISLQSDLIVTQPYLTIAGQTAPSPGIQVAGRTFSINTHDVLMQHLRIRVGDDGKVKDDKWNSMDALRPYGRTCERVVLDHLTANWSIDEIVGTGGGARDITLSNSILSEPLRRSVHGKGDHGYVLLMGRDTFRFSCIGSLLSHGLARMPRVQSGTFLFANNFVYDTAAPAFSYVGEGDTDSEGPIYLSVVGNQFRSGPSGHPSSGIFCGRMPTGSRIYAADNVYPSGPVVNSNCRPFISSSAPPSTWPGGFTPKVSSEVIDFVITHSGARPAERDAVENRIIKNALRGTGAIIDSQRQVGGFPTYPMNTRAFVVPANPHADDNGNGYTNIEEVLYQMALQVEGRR